MSTYAAVTYKQFSGMLELSLEAESAARSAAETNEREAIKARDLEAKARAKAEKLVELAVQQNGNALESQREISILIFQRLRNFAGTQDLQEELIGASMKGLHAITEVMDKLAPVGAKGKAETAIAKRTLAGIYQRPGG